MTKEECIKYSMALSFAAKKHAGQRRKDGTPYILHPIRVSKTVADYGLDVRYQIAALFHDLLEDTDATEEELGAFCDEEMLRAIKLVTKEDGYKEEEYISAILADPMAKQIKNADRIDNLTELPLSNNVKFQRRYMIESRDYFYKKFSPELDRIYEKNLERFADTGDGENCLF